ncbi:MAG: GH3 auxin-responsive promoter family protein, partial [Bacteroidetes bacterium]|nr:GH3 auxin-responsive promoter family protein [Bacteroidota bacterium]
MAIINSIVSWLNVKRLHQIELFKSYPFNVQQDSLLKLIQKSAETEWGKKYNYADITNIPEFQNNVPVQTYD